MVKRYRNTNSTIDIIYDLIGKDLWVLGDNNCERMSIYMHFVNILGDKVIYEFIKSGIVDGTDTYEEDNVGYELSFLFEKDMHEDSEIYVNSDINDITLSDPLIVYTTADIEDLILTNYPDYEEYYG